MLKPPNHCHFPIGKGKFMVKVTCALSEHIVAPDEVTELLEMSWTAHCVKLASSNKTLSVIDAHSQPGLNKISRDLCSV